MFEGWASELLASYLGHFFDVKKEQLRISLWSAWSTGLVLKDLKLKTEAFDNLQLPCAILEGRLGRLEVQVPWRALGSQPVVLEVSDVWLLAAPWDESELHEGGAGRRAQAAKAAQLLAEDLARAAKPGSGPEARGLAQSFLAHLARLLLNKLQLRVHNVHICFTEGPGGQRLGLQLQTLAIQQPDLEDERLWTPDEASKGALSKSVSMVGICAYMEPAGDESAPMATSRPAPEDVLLAPLSCNARVAMLSDSSNVTVEAQIDGMALRLHREQLQGLARVSDATALWTRRVQFAQLRPQGWRTGSPPPCWRQVWVFAIKAVMLQQRQALGWRRLRAWRQQRRDYVSLYRRHLQTARSGRLDAEETDLALRRLEHDLPVPDILLFRSLAERNLGHLDRQGSNGSVVDAPPERQRGWMPGIWTLLGYVPVMEDQTPLQPPTESDIQELYQELNFDPQAAARNPEGSLSLQLEAQVSGLNFELADARDSGSNILQLELGLLRCQLGVFSGMIDAALSIATLALLDLTSGGPGIQQDLLTVLTTDESLEQLGGGCRGGQPAVEIVVTTGSSDLPNIEARLQPLQLLFAAPVFARLAKLADAVDESSDSLGSREVAAINRLSPGPAQTLAKARMLSSSPGPTFKVKLLDFVVLLGEQMQISSGVLTIQSGPPRDPEEAGQQLQELAAAGPSAAQALVVQVEQTMLYDELQIEAAALQVRLEGPGKEGKFSEGLVLPLQLLASLQLSRLRDVEYPGIHVRAEAALARMNASPAAVAAASSALEAAAAGSGWTRTPSSDNPSERREQPPVKLAVNFAGFQLNFQTEAKGQPEAKLGACTLQGLLSNHCLHAEVGLGPLQVVQEGDMEGLPSLLHIVHELRVDESRAMIQQSAAEGLLVSLELLGVALLGFQGEPADSVIRLRPEAQPQLLVTHRRTSGSSGTRVTVADASFGAGGLLKVVQLLTHPPDDKAEPGSEDAMARAQPEAEPPPFFVFEALRSRIVCPAQNLSAGVAINVPQLLLQLPLEGAPLRVEHHPIQAVVGRATHKPAGDEESENDVSKVVFSARNVSLLAGGDQLALVSIPAVQLHRWEPGKSGVNLRFSLPLLCVEATPAKFQALASASAWLEHERRGEEPPSGSPHSHSGTVEQRPPEMSQPREDKVAKKAPRQGGQEWTLLGEVTRVSVALFPDDSPAGQALVLDARLLQCRVESKAGGFLEGSLQLGSGGLGLTQQESGESPEPKPWLGLRPTMPLAAMRRTASAPVAAPLGVQLPARGVDTRQPGLELRMPDEFANSSPPPHTSSLTRADSSQVAATGLADFASLAAGQESAAAARAAALGASASRALQQLMPASSPASSHHGSLGSTSTAWRWQVASLSPRDAPSMPSASRPSSAALSEASGAAYLSARSSGSSGGKSGTAEETSDSDSELSDAAPEQPRAHTFCVPLGLLQPPAGSNAALSVTASSQRDVGLSVAIQPIALRLNTTGSEVAVARIHECLAALSEIDSPQPATDGADESVDSMNVTCTASCLVITLVAPCPSAGGHRQSEVPIAELECGVNVQLLASAGRVSIRQVDIDALNVDLSIANARQEEGCVEAKLGRLLSLKRARCKVAQRSGEMTLAGPRFDINVERAGMWASGPRLCVIAALAANLQQITRSSRGNTAKEEPLTVTSKAADASGMALAIDGCCVVINCVAVVLSTGDPGQEVNLVELALIGARASTRLSGGLLLVHAAAAFLADAYSNVKRGWEPAAERWPFAIQLEHAAPGVQASGGLLPGQSTVAISSKTPLELTAAPSLVKAARVLELLLYQASAVAASPQTLAAAAGAPNTAHLQLLGSSTFEIHNRSGVELDFWLRPEGEGPPRPSDFGEQLAVGECRELLLNPEASGNRAARYAGTPESFMQDDFQPGGEAGPSAATAVEAAVAEQRGQKALFFRLNHQEVACGPVLLESSSSSWLEISMQPARATGVPSSAKVFCQVSRQAAGGCTITISSGVKVVNHTAVPVDLNLQQSARSSWQPQNVAPGDSADLPALRAEPGMLCIRPAGAVGRWRWSVGVRLQPLLEQRAAGSGRVARQVTCHPSEGRREEFRFNFGVVPSADSAGWEIAVHAPLVLQNSLPVPASLSIKLVAGKGQQRHNLEPGAQVGVHSADAAHVAEVVLRPLGYQWSAPTAVPSLQNHRAARAAVPRDAEPSEVVEAEAQRRGDTEVAVLEAGEGRGRAALRLLHIVESGAGSHLLRLTCAAWVYNCAGLPIALRPANEDDVREQIDSVPRSWVAPYVELGFQPAGQPRSPAPQPTSRGGSQGLADALQSGHRGPARLEGPPGFSHTGSSSEISPSSVNTPSRWPNLQGGLQLRRGRLGLQLRLSQMRASGGRTLWSAPVQLDALGGAAVVSVPYPVPGAAAGEPDYRAAYTLAVTATQVPGGDGALAVHVRPRFMLLNRLDGAMQFRQQGCGGERELAPGEARPLHWPDAGRPPRLCLRMQEAGWLWSGGLGLDVPGDYFVKIRHKDRGITRLLRVDVSAGTGGVLTVSLSDQAAGFAPYRVDNCTSQTLHLSQLSYHEQEDVLRPYSSLNYAWDEPALPHKLALALPGNRRLGAFDLDKVGEAAVVSLRRLLKPPEGERKLQVLVRSEGPTRVLTVTDLQVHLPLPPLAPATLLGESLGWEAWSGSLSLSRAALGQVAVPPAGLHLEVRVDLAGVGVSLVAGDCELLYGRLSELKLRTTATAVRSTVELRISNIQVDNPLRAAAYPVLLACPTVAQRAGMGVVADTRSSGSQSAAAAVARLAAWKRRPAGVLCLERAEVHVAPLALEIEQEHLASLFGATTALLALESRPVARRAEASQLPLFDGGPPQRRRRRQRPEAKLYIERLLVGELTVTLSFLPANWGRRPPATASPQGSRLSLGLQQLLSLAGEVEGGCVRLQSLEMRHPLLGSTALKQQAYSHYLRAAVPQIVKLLGSANLLGDPVSVFHHLGLGFWSLLANPAAGLVQSARGEGPQRFAAGLGSGLSSLISNVVFAFGSATAKASGSAKKVLALLGVEQVDAAGLPLRQRRRVGQGDEHPTASLIAVLLNSLVGVMSEPIRGYDESGAAGLVIGAYKGVVGALVRPLASLLEASARVADGVCAWVVGQPEVVPRIRPPRHVALVQALGPYDEMQAVGRYLLGEVAGRKHALEDFRLCRRLEGGQSYLLLTSAHVLSVSWPGLRFLPSLHWSARLEDVMHVHRQRSEVHLLALRPPTLVIQQPAVVALRSRPGMLQEPPLQVACLQFQDEVDAVGVEPALRDAAAQACCLVVGGSETARRFGSAKALRSLLQLRASQALAACAEISSP